MIRELRNAICLHESVNDDFQFFGKKRVMELLRNEPSSASSNDVLNTLVRSLFRFTGTEDLRDDLTIIVMKKLA